MHSQLAEQAKINRNLSSFFIFSLYINGIRFVYVEMLSQKGLADYHKNFAFVKRTTMTELSLCTVPLLLF